MEKLQVLCCIFLAALIIGCQEKSITEPPDINTSATFTRDNMALDKDILSNYPNSMPILGMIPDPTNPYHTNVKVKGTLRYNLTINKESLNSLSTHIVELQMYLTAEIFGGYHSGNWAVAGYSNSSVNIPVMNSAITYIEKRFRVTGNCCGKLELVIKFRLTENLLEYDSMWLQKVQNGIKALSPD